MQDVAGVLAPLLLLLGCVVAGIGMTHLVGLPMLFEERVAFGTVAGAMVVALAGFLFALALGLGIVSVLCGALLAAVPAGLGYWRGRILLRPELGSVRDRWTAGLRTEDHPWPLWVLLVICWAFTVHLLAQAWTYRPEGLFAGYINEWGDWALHLTYAGSFAYGHNFPPNLPIDPGHRLSYHFGIDFLAASLVPLGASLPASLVLTSGLLGLAFPAVMYFAGLRFLNSPIAAALAVGVFAVGGGIGFIYFFGDIDKQGLAALDHIPREYTLNRDLNYQWLNWVLANLLPQRSTLFGFSGALIATSLLWSALRGARSWAPFAALGVFMGMAPIFDLYGYLTVMALVPFWAALRPRREWAAFFIPALVVGLPLLLWVAPGAGLHLRLQWAWMANTEGHRDGFLWFWFKNTGIFIPLLLVGQFWRSAVVTGFGLFFAPLWLWFVVPNVVAGFQPWDWSSTKIMVYWWLFGSLLVAAVLAAFLRRGVEGRALAVACCLLLGLSGTVDLARASDWKANSILFTDSSGLDVASWVRTHTDPKAVFLVAPQHNQPVPTLGGRTVVVGFAGWLSEYRFTDYIKKDEDVNRMLKGDPATPELVREYNVDYVVIGPQERRLGASIAYWDGAGRRLFQANDYIVYAVR